MSITYIEIDPTCIIYPGIRDGLLLGCLDFSDRRGEGGDGQGKDHENRGGRQSRHGA